MKRALVILLTLAMALSLLATIPFAASADGEEEASLAVWSGKANIKWYLDAIEENPEAEEFHINTAEDLAGLAYLVNAFYRKYESTTYGVTTKHESCYAGLWYNSETGDVLGFSLSGGEGSYCFNYEELGFYIPASEDKFNKSNGWYTPEYDEEVEYTIDGSAFIEGDDFKYKTIFLENDLVMNTGNAADWATEKPANVWMPIGGGRHIDSSQIGFDGNFIGGGHTISGLYFSTSDTSLLGVGLFGLVGISTSINVQDLVIENCYLNGGTGVGPVIGRTCNMANLFNCHVKNCIVNSFSNAGGMVGAVFGGTLLLEQCSAMNITVEARHSVGGFAGSANFYGMSLTDCIVTGTVKAFQVQKPDESYTGGWDVGVLVGRVVQGTESVYHVIADVALTQEGQNADSNYTPSAGSVYGAVAKGGKTPTVEISGYYYVNKITADGDILKFDATEVQESQILGKQPKIYVANFDFTEVWDYGANGEFPVLRNLGQSTYEAEEEPVNPPVNPDEHVFTADTWVPEKKATCAADGVKAHYHCSHCGQDFAVDKETVLSAAELKIAATGHTYGDLIPATEATADAEGMKAHYECSVCHKLFDESKKEVSQADLTIAKVEKKGCFGVITGVPFVAIVILGAALVMRKKENESK